MAKGARAQKPSTSRSSEPLRPCRIRGIPTLTLHDPPSGGLCRVWGHRGVGPAIGHNGRVRITFATAELSPVVTVGGLAAASAGLIGSLRRSGVQVDVLLPDYGGVDLDAIDVIELDVPQWAGPASIRVVDHPDVGLLHLVAAPGLARSHPYLQPDGQGWLDNVDRFLRFSRSVAAYVELSQPDVLHLNDWHTAAALAALESPPPTVLSLHNLAHQGHGPGEWLERIGPRAEHFEWWGGINPLSGAIALADRIVAVSPHHATEITTQGGGFGLDAALRARGSAVLGILNGIDTTVWDPATDPHLPAHFDRKDLSGKERCRHALLQRVGLDDDGSLLATVVTRLTDQKGIDLLLPAIALLADVPMQLIVLGSGDRALADALAHAADDSDRCAFVEGYDETLSHLMFAGADLFVMPSRFEPCGLTQMQAMRYGTIPIVTPVGGLVDTVPDIDADARRGYGVVARSADPVAIMSALHRASRRFGQRRLDAVRKRIMAHDWSWDAPAERYRQVYQEIS